MLSQSLASAMSPLTHLSLAGNFNPHHPNWALEQHSARTSSTSANDSLNGYSTTHLLSPTLPLFPLDMDAPIERNLLLIFPYADRRCHFGYDVFEPHSALPSAASVTYTYANYKDTSLLLEGKTTHRQSIRVFGEAAWDGLSCDNMSLSLLGEVSKPTIDDKLFCSQITSGGSTEDVFARSRPSTSFVCNLFHHFCC